MKKKSTWQRVDELSCWVKNHHLAYKFSDQPALIDWAKAKGDNHKRNPCFIYVKADWTSCKMLQPEQLLVIAGVSCHWRSSQDGAVGHLHIHSSAIYSLHPHRFFCFLFFAKEVQEFPAAGDGIPNFSQWWENWRSSLIMTDYYPLLLLLLALCQTKLFLLST